MGHWICHRWICVWGAPDVCPPNCSETLQNKGIRASGLKIRAPQNADPTTTDPTPHSLPSEYTDYPFASRCVSHLYRDTFAEALRSGVVETPPPPKKREHKNILFMGLSWDFPKIFSEFCLCILLLASRKGGPPKKNTSTTMLTLTHFQEISPQRNQEYG